MSDRTDIEAWPEVLRTIAQDERLGVEVALRLARAFGGTEIYVSANPRDGAEILKHVSRARCKVLVELFGAGRLMIPMGTLTSDRERRQAIRRLLRAGRSHTFIARSVRAHLMTVKRERARMIADGERPATAQLRLFESP